MSLDRKDLKIQALLEKISNLTTTYEDQIANLRVDLTVTDSESREQIQHLQSEVDKLRTELASYEGAAEDGNVTEDED